MSLLLSVAPLSATATSGLPQAKGKSQVEKFIQNVAKIKSKEIDYAYISTSMFRQMFTMAGADVDISGVGKIFGSIRYLRRFVTTGDTGYALLSDALRPFLQEDEKVMGLELMALNRNDGETSVIYGDKSCVLVVNDSDRDELSVVFIAGLTYEAFMQMSEEGVFIGF